MWRILSKYNLEGKAPFLKRSTTSTDQARWTKDCFLLNLYHHQGQRLLRTHFSSRIVAWLAMALLEEDAAMMDELHSSVEDAFVGHRDVGGEHGGAAVCVYIA